MSKVVRVVSKIEEPLVLRHINATVPQASGGGMSEMSSVKHLWQPSGCTDIDDLISPDTSQPSTAAIDRMQCPLCSKSYLTFFGLRRHMQCHQDGRVDQTCAHCNKHYKSPGALKMHLKTHSLPCVCEKCGKSFSRPWLLKGHQRTHTGPYDFGYAQAIFFCHQNLDFSRCGHCELSFARVQVLEKHKAVCALKLEARAVSEDL
nr:Zinc finger domain containing protein [Haemonchus contortus]